MRLRGNRRWVPLILAWYQAPQWGKGQQTGSETKNVGELSEPSGRPEGATLSSPKITSGFASLAYFFPQWGIWSRF